jgi:heme A synthase
MPVVESLERQITEPRRLARASAVATYLLIVMGAVVRVSGSGLGCPDWPRCHGRWIPPLERTAIIEYGHRSMAVVVGVLVLWLVVASWRERGTEPIQFSLSVAALAILFFQAWLGRVVVLGELDATMVTVHLGTAMVLLATLMAIWLGPRRGGGWAWDRSSIMFWVAGLGTLIVILVGAYVRGLGAGMAFGDWPLMDGTLFPDVSGSRTLVAYLHRLSAGLLLIYLGYLVLAMRSRGGRLVRAAWWMLTVYSVQAVVGGLTVLTHLGPILQVSHVALGALSWAVTFGAATSASSGSAASATPSMATPGPG